MSVRLRPVFVALTLVLFALAAIETVVLYGIIDSQDAIGVDLVYYQDVGRRWLETGVYYTDRQLGGPYQQQTLVDNRTELVVFITPRLVENEVDMKDVLHDLRRRTERLDSLFPPNVLPDGTRAPVMTPWSPGDPIPLHPAPILIPPPEPAPASSIR